MKQSSSTNSKLTSVYFAILSFLFFSCNSNQAPINNEVTQSREYNIEEFKYFFANNKNPDVEQMIKLFGQPKLHTLYIGDSIAKQNGDFEPTLDRAAWIYQLKDVDEFIAIQVDHGQVLDVTLGNRKSKTTQYIRKRVKQD